MIRVSCTVCGDPLPTARHKVTCGRKECETARRHARYAQARPGCQVCGGPLPYRHRVACGESCWRVYRRRNRPVSNAAFGVYVKAIINRLRQRVGDGDVAEIGALFEVMRASEEAVVATITGLRAAGYSWADIGREAGMSKQAIFQWHARRTARSPNPEEDT